MSQVNWILGIVILHFILFIIFAIFVIYYSYKAENQANETITKLQTEFEAANTKIDTLNNQLTPVLNEISADIAIINDGYKKYEPLVESYLCTNYPLEAKFFGLCGN